MEEVEIVCQGALRKATARECAVSQVAPENPSADSVEAAFPFDPHIEPSGPS